MYHSHISASSNNMYYIWRKTKLSKKEERERHDSGIKRICYVAWVYSRYQGNNRPKKADWGRLFWSYKLYYRGNCIMYSVAMVIRRVNEKMENVQVPSSFSLFLWFLQRHFNNTSTAPVSNTRQLQHTLLNAHTFTLYRKRDDRSMGWPMGGFSEFWEGTKKQGLILSLLRYSITLEFSLTGASYVPRGCI